MNVKYLITKIWERRDFLLIAIISFLFIMLFKQCNSTLNLKNRLDIQSLNIDALNDTIRVQKNKAGEDMFVKKTLLADKKNLEKLNVDLSNELKKVKDKVIFLQKTIAEIKSDTQYVPTYLIKYADGSYSLDWELDTSYSEGNYRKLSASSFFLIDSISHRVIPGRTQIKDDVFGFSFVTGLKEKSGSLEIFVTPKYPGMQITSIEGAVIDPHKSEVLKKMFPTKKWSVGPYAGLGIGSGSSFTGTPFFGPVFSLGVAVQYSWFKF
jgi:hypothetical protein